MEEKTQNVVEQTNQEERMYTASEVSAIVDQYKIKLDQLKRSATEEIEKRELSNFYQTLSVLFEIVRNRDAYSAEFIKKAVAAIEKGVNSIFDDGENVDKNKDE